MLRQRDFRGHRLTKGERRSSTGGRRSALPIIGHPLICHEIAMIQPVAAGNLEPDHVPKSQSRIWHLTKKLLLSKFLPYFPRIGRNLRLTLWTKMVPMMSYEKSLKTTVPTTLKFRRKADSRERKSLSRRLGFKRLVLRRFGVRWRQ